MNKKPSTAKAASAGAASTQPGGTALTVSHFLGEMTWLLTQSPLHRRLAINDLEWLVMPALVHEQFYVFRDGEQPVGLALWAKCTPEAARKLDHGMIEPDNRLTLDEWVNGDQIWLVDLVAPFANAENRQRELMIADLISKPFAGKEFRFHQTDPSTGKRTVQVVDANAGEKLKEALLAATRSDNPSSLN